jgi:1,3-beta-galactosyl-N-acetylhexosamine phosphorylase
MQRYFEINESGHNIRCKIYFSDMHAIRSVVVFCHGFGGHKDNTAAEKFAERLLNKYKGIAMVTYNWPCHGDDVKKKLRLRDCDIYLQLVIEYVKKQLHAERVYCYATSFGGYLALAAKFPKFIERAGQVCDEFRAICDAAGEAKPYSGLTVAILNAWGAKRSWMCHMVAHELWYQQVYSYQGVYEALSGLGVDVRFISFDDIKKNGIDKDIDVILNVGDEGTAFSGGEYWNDEQIVTTVRQWVAEGHGFIGVGEPTAYRKGGRTFVLADVLGVDKEKGFTLSDDKYNIQKKAHFITEEVVGEIDYGEGMKNVYAYNGADVLDIEISPRFVRNVNVGEVKLAANTYGKGRGVYVAGLPYSPQNSRLLLRAMFWSANKEAEMKKAYSSNPVTDCTYYPETKKYAVINNTNEQQATTFYDVNGKATEMTLAPNSVAWVEA